MLKKTMQKMLFTLIATLLVGLFSVGVGMAEPAKKKDPAQFARGAKAWAENCNRCHNVRDPKELTDWEWEVSVNHMAKLGNIPRNIARDIEAFLKGSN